MTEEKNRINQIYDSLVDTDEPELNIRENQSAGPL